MSEYDSLCGQYQLREGQVSSYSRSLVLRVSESKAKCRECAAKSGKTV